MADSKQDLPVIVGSPGALKDAHSVGANLKTGNYGLEYQQFMGITGDSSDLEIGNTPAEWNRASYEGAVFRCLDLRGAAAASIALKVWDNPPGQNNRKSIDHEALQVLDQTNPFNFIAGTELFRYTVGSRDLHGHAAWRFAFDRRGMPSEIYWLQPEVYRPIRDSRGLLGGLRVQEQGAAPYTIPLDQIAYFPTVNIRDPLSGFSKISALRESINLKRYGRASNIWFFKNNMRPDWILTGAWQTSQETIGLLKRLISSWLGSDARRGPLIVGSDTKAQLLTMSPKDAEWIQQQKISLEEICAVFGVPLPIYGNMDRSTYDNFEASIRAFWTISMIPELDNLADQMTRWYLWRWPDAKRANLKFGWDYAAVEALQEDAARIWERFMVYMAKVSEAVKNRQITPNQSRVLMRQEAKKLGLDPKPWKGNVDGGDTFFVRLQEIPILEASVQANIDVNAARASGSDTDMPPPGSPPAAPPPTAPPPATDAPPKARGAGPSVKTVYVKALDHQGIRERRLGPVRAQAERRLKRFFQDLQTEILRSLRQMGKAQDPSDPHPQATPADFGALYDREAAMKRLQVIAEEAFEGSSEAAYEAARDDYGLSVDWNADNPWFAAYKRDREPEIKGIDDTTFARLMDTLKEGALEGETIPELGSRVREVMKSAIDNRSLTIARTETIKAYGHASLNAYREGGVEEAEIYDGDGDEECAAMNGQIVSLDEASSLMDDEHPNGTRGFAPVVATSNTDQEDAA